MIAFLFMLVIFFTVIGQLLLKYAALNNNKVIYLTIGYAVFVVTVIFSFYLMKHIDLKTFTVLNSIIYVAVLFSSILFFRESVTINKIIGTILVIIGVIVFNL